MGEKKKETDWSDYLGIVLGGGFAVVIVGGGLWEWLGPYVHGTTPADLESVSLEASPDQLGHALSATDVQETSVRANFRVSAGKPYRYAELRWDNKRSLDAPTSMSLVAEHEAERSDEVRAALSRRFHGLHNGGWNWGPVSISSDRKHGDVSFTVQRNYDGKPNALLERQIDAARQIVLEAAFGIAPHATDQELAELLGTGYPLADIAKIDPAATVEEVERAFPGSLHESSANWETIAVNHPLVKSVTLGWPNQRGGRVTSVSLSVTDAYAPSREMLDSCLETKLGAPAGQKKFVFAIGPVVLTLDATHLEFGGEGWDAGSWSRTFAALASCTDAAETTGSQGDAKKK